MCRLSKRDEVSPGVVQNDVAAAAGTAHLPHRRSPRDEQDQRDRRRAAATEDSYAERKCLHGILLRPRRGDHGYSIGHPRPDCAVPERI